MRKSARAPIAVLVATVVAVVVVPTFGDILIDPQFPIGGTSSPLPMPILYQFHTSWDGIAWTEEQKESARGALAYLGGFFAVPSAFAEEASPDDFSIRWAGADFFKDHGEHGGWDLDFDGALAVAAKTQIGTDAPWDKNKYPLGEIYFNTKYRWHFNPFTDPDEGKSDDPTDPSSYTDGEFDFWSILLHETIHMLCVNKHAEHSNEVMYPTFSDGERRWTIQESDKQLLREAGYPIVPVPDAAGLVLLGLGVLLSHRRAAVHSASTPDRC